jgi:hypothetical protein
MVFKVKQADGTIDPRININGRAPKPDTPITNIQVRNRELISLLRKVKPLLSVSIKTAFEIVQDEDSKDVDRLKASALIIGLYKDLVKDVYDKDYDEKEVEEEIQPVNKAPIFSLTMVKNGEEIKKQ